MQSLYEFVVKHKLKNNPIFTLYYRKFDKHYYVMLQNINDFDELIPNIDVFKNANALRDRLTNEIFTTKKIVVIRPSNKYLDWNYYNNSVFKTQYIETRLKISVNDFNGEKFKKIEEWGLVK